MRTALKLLRCDARLVLTIANGRVEYSIEGDRVGIAVAKRILRRRDIVVDDPGLFVDHPQSWRRLARRPRP
jgi:hypothetical protein